MALPLLDEFSKVRGILAVWNAEEPVLDADAVELLRVFSPIFALQLQHGSDMHLLKEKAEADALTGLANRHVMDEALSEADAHFRRYRRPVGLLVLDIDHFKAVNDSYGHAAGDAVLRVVANIVDRAVREVDTAARYGGEEFVVLLDETMRRGAVDVAERLRTTIEETPVQFGGEQIHVKVSIGVSACPECVEQPAGLMASADAMLYRSKESGRNRVTAAPVG
ncbi:MAG: diguanylate cyclase [Gammaproteobacteria bacterium]|nr:GGDEF domain-containing protein [Gemmatimonadota bacterium]NIU77286.1 diguanylate cyclase [Gammaproteobacteria bacterium]